MLFAHKYVPSNKKATPATNGVIIHQEVAKITQASQKPVTSRNDVINTITRWLLLTLYPWRPVVAKWCKRWHICNETTAGFDAMLPLSSVCFSLLYLALSTAAVTTATTDGKDE